MLLYRVTVFGVPKGPWREDREQARRDAIEQELGCYDERGTFYLIVPGEMQVYDSEQLRRVA
jgi:hypothetical protein